MKLDPFLVGIAIAIGLAALAPQLGASQGLLHLPIITTAGIALVFFLHGAAVSREALHAAVANWRLHLFVQASTYLLFPAIGYIVYRSTGALLSEPVRLGFFYLCAVSSTISSSVAMTAMARGNVPGAIFDATLSGLLGMVLTPLLLGLVTVSSGADVPVLPQILDICVQLLLPFVLGQFARRWLADLLSRHKALVGQADRAVILLIVYSAFCDAFAERLLGLGNVAEVLQILLLSGGLLTVVLLLTTFAARRFGFPIEDEIAAVFCGSKKSLANGAPIAKVIFGASPQLSLILLPLLFYHQIQLIVCTVLARRYARRLEVGQGG